RSLARLDDAPIQQAASLHARTALERARLALALPQDVRTLEALAADWLEQLDAPAEPVKA
ncbi:MAG: hypothetical protein KDH91_23360, partial [Rhodoferax sp.]|nr:hypothetical protein [Rhodoferax sp.]